MAFEEFGILQKGHPVLSQYARPFQIPDEADEIRATAVVLNDVLEKIWATGVFSRGLGLAAPQIGLSRSAFVTRFRGSPAVELFVNPVVTEISEMAADDYEGCLSFWDYRGVVRRPLCVSLFWFDVELNRQERSFVDQDARLVLHEIDHLLGILYDKRMDPGASLRKAVDVKKERHDRLAFDGAWSQHLA